MPVSYSKVYYDYKVDGDFIDWLDDQSGPPNNWELVSMLPHGTPYVGGEREGHTGELAMRCMCIFKKTSGGGP